MNKEQIAYEKGYRVTKDGELIGLFNTKIGCVNGKGYEQTGIRLNKKHINLETHRLQAYEKYGNKLFEDGIVVRHLNGNALDNSWHNIAIGTSKDNYMDIPEKTRKEMLLAKIKYHKEFVIKLREEYKVVKNYNELARKYNISVGTIYDLINKRKVFKDA
tara:strand:- start:4412 stop:4891 length:480 start_codon:yes stop_codon:yes gene_type:complete